MDKIQEYVVQPGQLCITQSSHKRKFLLSLLSGISQTVNWSLAKPTAMMLYIICFSPSSMEFKKLLILFLCIQIQ